MLSKTNSQKTKVKEHLISDTKIAQTTSYKRNKYMKKHLCEIKVTLKTADYYYLSRFIM